MDCIGINFLRKVSDAKLFDGFMLWMRVIHNFIESDLMQPYKNYQVPDFNPDKVFNFHKSGNDSEFDSAL